MLVGGASAEAKSGARTGEPQSDQSNCHNGSAGGSNHNGAGISTRASPQSKVLHPWEQNGVPSVGLPNDLIQSNKVCESAECIVQTVNTEQLCTCFDTAQEEVFQLMHGDSYRRYVRSPLYAELESSARMGSAMESAGLS